jgi:hypothetical protein
MRPSRKVVRVVLRGCLLLAGISPAACRRGGGAPPAPDGPPRTVAEEACPQHAAHLAQVLSPGHCTVPRAVFFPSERCLTTGPTLRSAADGLHMVGIQSDSIYRKCGFAEGDLWTKINDVALSSPEEVLKVYPALRKAPSLTFSLLRAGQPLTIRVDLR